MCMSMKDRHHASGLPMYFWANRLRSLMSSLVNMGFPRSLWKYTFREWSASEIVRLLALMRARRRSMSTVTSWLASACTTM